MNFTFSLFSNRQQLGLTSPSSDLNRSHGVIIFFVRLHVLTEFHLAVSVEVKLAVEYNFTDGLCVLEMPPFKANMLRQNTAMYTMFITMVGDR